MRYVEVFDILNRFSCHEQDLGTVRASFRRHDRARIGSHAGRQEVNDNLRRCFFLRISNQVAPKQDISRDFERFPYDR